MLQITHQIAIPLTEIDITAVRAQGPGGQNGNKVSSAVHLRFDSGNSSLPEPVKKRLLTLRDKRISKDGMILLKAQRFRSQEQNRRDALDRLVLLLRKATISPKQRKATKPSQAAHQKRLDRKVQRGRLKVQRGRVDPHHE